SEQSLDTSPAGGRAFYGMLAVLAAFETDVRRECQLEGIAMARRQGVYKGGKQRLDGQRVQELSSQGLSLPPLRASWGWPAAQSTGSSNRRAAGNQGRQVPGSVEQRKWSRFDQNRIRQRSELFAACPGTRYQGLPTSVRQRPQKAIALAAVPRASPLCQATSSGCSMISVAIQL